MCGLQIWRSGDIHSPVEEFIAPAVHCLVFEALSDWHFGETARCHRPWQKPSRWRKS
jgi:hypothetical protein